jgi:hypothetical protein
MIEQGLAEYMIGDPTVGQFTGGRVHGGGLLPKDPQLPAVTYQIAAAVPIASLDGSNQTQAKRLQFDGYAKEYIAVRQLMAAVRTLLLPVSGTGTSVSYNLPDGTFVQGVILHSDHDMGFETGPGGYIHRALLDLEFIFTPGP